MTIIAVLWLLVIVGVLSPATLSDAKGTVVTPLAALVGPAVNLLGSLLVILSLGLATIQVSLAQYYSLEERLPAPGSVSWVGKLPPTQRFWLCVSPMALVLALALWLLSSGIANPAIKYKIEVGSEVTVAVASRSRQMKQITIQVCRWS